MRQWVPGATDDAKARDSATPPRGALPRASLRSSTRKSAMAQPNYAFQKRQKELEKKKKKDEKLLRKQRKSDAPDGVGEAEGEDERGGAATDAARD